MADTSIDNTAERLKKSSDELKIAREKLAKLKEISEPTSEQIEEIARTRQLITRLASRVNYYKRDKAVRKHRYATDSTAKERRKQAAKTQYANMRAATKKLAELGVQISE